MSNSNALKSLGYDNPSYLTRQSAQLAANTAGSGNTSGKFYAHAALTVFGVTFMTLTAGTSTYTVGGTATAQACQFSAIYISNTSTTTVALTTNTVGGFTIGGTAPSAQTSGVGAVQGIGGLAGGFQGPYAINTLGGTNTSQVWGSNTYVTFTPTTTAQVQASPPGGNAAGFGGLPMNPGDVLYFVNGTDATAIVIPVVQYSLQSPNALVVA